MKEEEIYICGAKSAKRTIVIGDNKGRGGKMKNKSLFGIIAVIAALAVVISTSIPGVAAINPTSHIIEEPIRSGEADGFVTSLLSQGNLINDSSFISIGQEAEDVFSLKFAAYLRFSNITIPTDAKISKAYITVVPTFTNQTGPLMEITAANRPNPTAPKNYSDYFDNVILASILIKMFLGHCDNMIITQKISFFTNLGLSLKRILASWASTRCAKNLRIGDV